MTLHYVCTPFWCRIRKMVLLNIYIYLPWINTHRQTTSSFDDTPVISSRDQNSCEGDRVSDIIFLLRQSQAIQNCNQSVLVIVPYLNIFVFIITIVDLILGSALVQLILLRARYLYNSTELRFYIFCLLPASRLCDRYCHRWVHYIDTMKYGFKVCAI